MNAPARLALRTLGGFALESDDARVRDPAYEKGRALLAFLAVEPGGWHARAALAAMFWPALDREAALTNLRQVLHDLRRTFDASGLARSPLEIERESVRMKPVSGLFIDTHAFASPAPSCPAGPIAAHCKVCLRQMEDLAALYRGEFMAGFSLPDCPDFEAWLLVQREAFHLHALALLARLCECLEGSGACARALLVALRFLELEPWNEEGLRRVMRLFALTGQRAKALAHYQTCRLALKRELDVLPDEATRALAQSIERGELSSATGRPTNALPAAATLPGAERRQLTVLYCELSCAGADDPDEALALLDAPQARCAEIIRSHSGHLVQTHGGGLLAYFGFPQASENASRLAVQAALALTAVAFPGVESRAGVHTGLVISGSLQLPDVIGATSGLAIRLRQVAERGEVAISAATAHLVAGYFECQSLGRRQLRGIAQPLEVFRAVRESGARDRLETQAALSPLVGRQKELARLRALWQEARAGARRATLLCGEAGVGKSRLVLTLKQALRGEACVIAELRCAPEHSQTPFRPLLEWLASSLGFSAEDDAQARFAKLEAAIAAHEPKRRREAVVLLAKMLSLPLRAPYRAPPDVPAQRERTLAVLLEQLHALAAGQPCLLIVEDLQWADPSTLELLRLLLGAERRLPMLAVLTARPDFAPPWPASRAPALLLDALNARETTALIASVAPELAPPLVERIVERADGIPLFAEELARELADGDQSVIPSTLRDLLSARLDSMGAAKALAQAAASVGREFGVELLRQITPFDEATLAQLLGQLSDSGLLQGGGQGMLCFKHALLRDAAYQSQTRGEREAMHRRIAAALNALGGEVRPELLAQHWAAGAEVRQAVRCWIEAGRLANNHSANREAIAHFRAGLALIDALPAGVERGRMELELQIGLGAASSAVHGYAFAEGTTIYERAMALYREHGSDPAMFQAIWRLWSGASSRAGYAHAQELAQQLLRMADRSGDPVQRQQAHFAVANTFYWQGELVAARQHLEAVEALYRPLHHADHVAGFGEDAGITAASYLSWVLCLLGFPDQASRASARALTLARQLKHPFSLAYALTFAALLNCRLGQPQEALALARETLALAREHAFTLWEIGATTAQGWVLVMQQRREGVELMRGCTEATGAAMGGVTLVVLEPLIQGCLLLGDFAAAGEVAEQAFAVGRSIGDHHVDAELHRLKGECLLASAPAGEAAAAAAFQRALAISRAQRAKCLELRAATSLARLWQRQGKRAAALALLEDSYHSFSEGFATADLRAARELLDALSA